MPIWCQRDQNRSAERHLVIPSVTLLAIDIFIEADFPWDDAVPNKVIPNVDMLRDIVVNQIFWQSDDTLTIVVDNWSRVRVDLSKRVRQPTKPKSLFPQDRRGYVFYFDHWGNRALLKFGLPWDCLIAEFESISGCWFSTIHTACKVWVGVTK